MLVNYDPLRVFVADSIVQLKDGRAAHYRGPARDGTSAEVVILPGNTVTAISPDEIASVLMQPRDLVQYWLASLQPVKTISVETIAGGDGAANGHVASVQVGPNPNAFHAVEAPTREAAIVQVAEEAGLLEVNHVGAA